MYLAKNKDIKKDYNPFSQEIEFGDFYHNPKKSEEASARCIWSQVFTELPAMEQHHLVVHEPFDESPCWYPKGFLMNFLRG